MSSCCIPSSLSPPASSLECPPPPSLTGGGCGLLPDGPPPPAKSSGSNRGVQTVGSLLFGLEDSCRTDLLLVRRSWMSRVLRINAKNSSILASSSSCCRLSSGAAFLFFPSSSIPRLEIEPCSRAPRGNGRNKIRKNCNWSPTRSRLNLYFYSKRDELQPSYNSTRVNPI